MSVYLDSVQREAVTSSDKSGLIKIGPVRGGTGPPHAGKFHEWGRVRRGVAEVWGMEFETMLILTVLAVQGVNLLFVAFLASRFTGLILE